MFRKKGDLAIYINEEEDHCGVIYKDLLQVVYIDVDETSMHYFCRLLQPHATGAWMYDEDLVFLDSIKLYCGDEACQRNIRKRIRKEWERKQNESARRASITSITPRIADSRQNLWGGRPRVVRRGR